MKGDKKNGNIRERDSNTSKSNKKNMVCVQNLL